MLPENERERKQREIVNEKIKNLWEFPPVFFDNSCWNHLTEDEYIDNLEKGLRNSVKIDRCQTLIGILFKNKEFLDKIRVKLKLIQYIIDNSPNVDSLIIADQITDYRTFTLIYLDWFDFVQPGTREDITSGILSWLWINYKEIFINDIYQNKS